LTDWLPPSITRDDWGYIVTAPPDGGSAALQFATTVPGVFAVGDVRQASVKRVASAAGEGAACVRLVHEHLEVLDTES
jgi:thioredoxin reductase (NADPH)